MTIKGLSRFGRSSHTHIHTEIGLCSSQYTGDAQYQTWFW